LLGSRRQLRVRRHDLDRGQRRVLVSRDHVAGEQQLLGVVPHEEREVGLGLHELAVVEAVTHDHVGQPERQCAVGARPDDDGAVGLAGG
jgi:hypothetical protein